MMKKWVSFACVQVILALFTVSLLSCHGESSESKPAVPVPLQKQLSLLIPGKVNSSLPREGTVEFYGENLYELIDGAAGIFHDYDFVALGHATYQKGDTECTADIYDMGEPLNAFGVFSVESSPDYTFIQTGDAGYLEEGILNFYQGRYYIKLSAYSPDEKTAPLLRHLASEISARIKKHHPSKTNRSVKQLLSLFPSQNLVPHSHKYSKKAPLGFQFLAPAIQADYQVEKTKTTVVLSLVQNQQEALSRLQQVRERIQKTGSVNDFPEGGTKAFRGKDKYRGDIIGFVHASETSDPYTVLVVKPPQDVGLFLHRLIKTLDRK